MASTLNSLRVISDPTRLRLVALLQPGELSVAEVQEILGMGQSRISSHLATLKRAGLLEDRRVGKNIYYRWAQAQVFPPEQLRTVVELARHDMPELAQDELGLSHVLAKRKDRTREYFDRLAGRFGRNHCPGRSWQALAHLLLTLLPAVDVADLGAGEGTLSQLLARRARRVIAVDISEKMVAFGAELARKHGFTNLEYRLGDLEDPPIEPHSVDLAIFSQALHHANHPNVALAAAHRILRPGGRVLILDLLTHSYEQARELYADLWLGFSEVELLRLLEGARFGKRECQVVARETESPFFQTLFATGVRA